MSEDINKIISKYKMYMSFDGNEYEMIQKLELNKIFEEIEKLQKQLQQKENIIKEVREYINKNKASLPMGRDEFTCEMRYSDEVVLAHEVLEILDKENKWNKKV